MEQRIWPARAIAAVISLTWVVIAHSAPLERNTRLAQAYEAIDRALAASTMPGLVVGITDRTQTRKIIVHGFADLKARTPLTAASLFAIGSVSKGFTAIALMQLMDEGQFDPHVPITRYLPVLAIPSPFAPITGHDLLSHSAGLPDYVVDASSSRYAMVKLRDFKPSYAPGAHWWYSNTGFQLLGYALEDIEKQPYPGIIQRRILDPLGMTSTAAVIDDDKRKKMTVSYMRWPYDGSYVEAPWFEYTAGDGSIVSNADDMCGYVRFMLNRGMGPKARLLSERAFAALTSPVLEDYAYGLFVHKHDGTTVISHTGGIAGFSSEIEAHMEDGFGVVFLSNGGIDPALESWIVKTVTAAYHGDPLPAPPEVPTTPPPANIQQYAGLYHANPNDQGSDSTVEFLAADGKLQLRKAQKNTPLESMGKDTFRETGPDSGALPFFFGRQGDPNSGKVVEVSRGTRWYVNKDFVGEARTPIDHSYDAYVGHFENNGPEGPAARIFVRNGRLMASLFAGESSPSELSPSGTDGTFRFAEPAYSPEYLRFDTVIDGHALRLDMTGVSLYRKDSP